MKDQGIQPGDIVILKSGSKQMTVEAVKSKMAVQCAWHDIACTGIQKATFTEAALKKVEPHEKPKG